MLKGEKYIPVPVSVNKKIKVQLVESKQGEDCFWIIFREGNIEHPLLILRDIDMESILEQIRFLKMDKVYSLLKRMNETRLDVSLETPNPSLNDKQG